MNRFGGIDQFYMIRTGLQPALRNRACVRMKIVFERGMLTQALHNCENRAESLEY